MPEVPALPAVDELVGPTGNAALRDTDSSVLIVNRRHL
jgi:hypothetical protein